MTATAGLALAAGGLGGGGIALFVVAVRGFPMRNDGPPPLIRRLLADRRAISNRLTAGIVAGLVTLVLTRWPVMGLGVGLLVAYWDRIAGSGSDEKGSIVRLESLAVWTESLRDTIAGANGLEQAIPSSATAAPAAIRPSLNLLVDRLRIREPLADALLAFAEDFNDASADTVVSALVLNARLRGPGLRDVLTALAVSTREELDLRRRIEAGRRSIRRSVRIVVAIVLGIAGMLAVFNRSYVAPYGSVLGQLVLLVVSALFLGGLLWLRMLARPATVERFLVSGKSSEVGRMPGSR